jgi:uncharacterized protein YodC (DUF2158 family)
MEQKFKVGDIVRLRSGGENMTVSGYKTKNTGSALNAILKHTGRTPRFDEVETQTVVCSWFENKKMESAEFDEDALELVTVS